MKDSQPQQAIDVILITDPDELERYAHHPDWVIRVEGARNPDTREDTLTWLGADPSYRVREAVAEYPKVPIETLADLIHESDPCVRASAISNAAAPADLVVDALCDSTPAPDWALMLWVHGTPMVPPDEVLKKMLSSPDMKARTLAFRSFDLGRKGPLGVEGTS